MLLAEQECRNDRCWNDGITAYLSPTCRIPAGIDVVVRRWLGAIVEIGDRWARERKLSKRAIVDRLVAMLLATVETNGIEPPS